MQPSIISLVLNIFFTGAIAGVLAVFAYNVWMTYMNTLYLNSVEWIMLEITPPKEVFKSPEAMELVLNALHGGGATNWYLKFWKGELSQYYSLEIASIEGKIHFYVRFNKKFRKAFEAMLYAQYPQAEVKEVEDYTKSVPEYVKGGPISLFGYHLKLNKDDPYPIKTYVDYGLDRAIGSLDEEQRIDPITPLLETMGSIGIGEQIWVQIIIRQDTKRFEVKKKKGEEEIIETGKGWKDKANEIIAKIRKEIADQGSKPTKGQTSVIDAIERHKNKPGFDTGIRVIYLAKKENFSGNTITAFTAMFRQFNSEDMNSFGFEGMTKAPDEPWKDFGNRKAEKSKKYILADYKDRAYFYGSFDKDYPLKSLISNPGTTGKKPFLLSSEEIATLYHLPGRVVSTPTFLRSEATKSEPPSNLPI
jgi:bifunctional DNA-binding transcriptional regulator/antitoxin component of YhaV-PrlF toxin-antitoxin module